MIIWINGPFGAGKTTLAKRLRDRRSKSLIFDPEEIGFVVKETVPMPASGDYQDLPLWLSLIHKSPNPGICYFSQTAFSCCVWLRFPFGNSLHAQQ